MTEEEADDRKRRPEIIEEATEGQAGNGRRGDRKKPEDDRRKCDRRDRYEMIGKEVSEGEAGG